MAAGYSSTSRARKPGITSGRVVSLDHSPSGWRLDDNQPTALVPGSRDPVEVILAFFSETDELLLRLPNLAERILMSPRRRRAPWQATPDFGAMSVEGRAMRPLERLGLFEWRRRTGLTVE